jgi:hypothetical protein
LPCPSVLPDLRSRCNTHPTRRSPSTVRRPTDKTACYCRLTYRDMSSSRSSCGGKGWGGAQKPISVFTHPTKLLTFGRF